MTELSKSAPKILICDVGPRDGLQSEERIWSVAERVELIDRLAASGLRRMEAVSFVNPKRVPQMAGAEEVMAAIKRPGGVQFAGLALNLPGGLVHVLGHPGPLERHSPCGVELDAITLLCQRELLVLKLTIVSEHEY